MGRRSGGLGDRLKELRRARGLSQAELGQPLCSAAYISQIENGARHSPSTEVALHLAQRLGVTIDELITGVPTGLEAELRLLLSESKAAMYATRYSEADELARRAIDRARSFEAGEVEAKGLELLALLMEKRGDNDGALTHFQKAHDLWQQLGAVADRADTVAGLARGYGMLGDSRYGIHLLESYLDELRKEAAPDPTALMRTFSALIYMYYGAGLPDRGLRAAREARALEAQSGDIEKVACMHLNVARAAAYEKQFGEALRSLERAEELFRSLDWRIEVAKANIAKGIIFREKEDFEAAEDVLIKAVDSLRSTPSNVTLGTALSELAQVQLELDDCESALKAATEAIELLNGDVAEVAICSRTIGLCWKGKGDSRRALKFLWRSVDELRIAQQPAVEAKTLGLIAQLLRDEGENDAAFSAYEDSLRALDELQPL